MTASAPAEDMQAVILCGGQGTRLREVTERVPKPLVDVGGKPILWHIMKLYRHHGVRRFVLCLGYKGDQIRDYFLRYREHLSDFTLDMRDDRHVVYHNAMTEDWEVTCVETGLMTGTGGRLGRVQPYIDGETFLFTYGDGIGDVDITGLLDFHRSHDKLATVTGVHPESRYGEMHVEGTAVVEFNEKPTVATGRVSGGFFVFDRGVFDGYVNAGVDLFLESEPLQKLARDAQLQVFPHDGMWRGMDTYRDYQHLNDLWASGKAPWKVWN